MPTKKVTKAKTIPTEICWSGYFFYCHPCQLYAATRQHEVTRSGFLLYVGSFDQTIMSGQVAPTPHQLSNTVYSILMFEIRTE
jgi:hypothetical protein